MARQFDSPSFFVTDTGPSSNLGGPGPDPASVAPFGPGPVVSSGLISPGEPIGPGPSLLDAALAYAARGWFVLPVWPIVDGQCACQRLGCDRPGKHPIGQLVPNGQTDATTNGNMVRQWWSAGVFASANIGLALAPSGLMALDVDDRGGHTAALAKLHALEAKLGPLPASPRQLSGSQEGLHLLFKKPNHEIRGEIGGITVRGANYIILTPSNHQSGGQYEWIDTPDEYPMAELPPAWSEALRKVAGVSGVPPADFAEPEWLRAISDEDRLWKARQKLKREFGEVYRETGAGHTFNVIRGTIRGCAIRSPKVALDLILTEYNPRCVPPWDEDRIADKVSQCFNGRASDPEWGHYLDPERIAEATADSVAEHAEFMEAMTAIAHPAPTKIDIKSRLTEHANDRSKAGTKHRILASAILKAETIVDEKDLRDAAVMLRMIPGITDEQINEHLVFCASGTTMTELPRIIAESVFKSEAHASGAQGTDLEKHDLFPPEHATALMNERFAWVSALGAVILINSERLEFVKKDSFQTTWDNKHVLIAAGTKDERKAPLGSWWLRDSRRNTYERVGVWPPPLSAPVRSMNRWKGFGVEPKLGDWSLMRSHIRDIIADGDKTIGDYIISWVAWLFQNPGQHAEATLVMRGTEGIGKGIFGNALGTIMGVHALQLTRPEQFVGGKFNSHMAECVFLFADECFWAGNPAHEGVLKGMITEATQMIEPKGLPCFPVLNLLHILISSNNEWVVPAGLKARRWVATNVSEAKRGDGDYFTRLVHELKHGGYEAMLFDLLAMDLGDWHPRNVVDSSALTDQKDRSLKRGSAWILEILRTGELPDPTFQPEGAWVSSENLRKDAANAGKLTDPEWRNALRDIGAIPRKDKTWGRGWKFPSLAEARATWCKVHYERTWNAVEVWQQ